MSHITSSEQVEPCQECGQILDVGELTRFDLVKCPRCFCKVRVRRQVGRYDLLGVLGEGGSSMVFRARIPDGSGGDIALKVLERKTPGYEESLVHLRNEVEFAGQVDHPKVVKVIDFEETTEGAWLVMELMEGGSLHDLINSRENFGEERMLETGLEILKALSAAYSKAIIHRDLKPANILFTTSGSAKLADFGLACHVSSKSALRGDIMATPDYVAPEIISGKAWDFRSDLYGLGGCLYHAITGRPPHKTEGECLQQLRVIKRHVVTLSFKDWKLHPQTATLINRMLLPDPENRFSSYNELEEHFLSALESVQATQRETIKAGVQRFVGLFRGKQ